MAIVTLNRYPRLRFVRLHTDRRSAVSFHVLFCQPEATVRNDKTTNLKDLWEES